MSNIKNLADVENSPLAEKKRIWYLCDGKKPDCPKTICYKNTDVNPCRHTRDIEHAVNFIKEGTEEQIGYWEAAAMPEGSTRIANQEKQIDFPQSVMERKDIINQMSKEIIGKIAESEYKISALDFLQILEETKKAGLKRFAL